MEIGIGLIGAGYMGKLHAVAFNVAAAVFNTKLRARLEMICTTTENGAQEKAEQFGFARSTSDWSTLVNDPRVEAIVIASPQTTHREIAWKLSNWESPCSAKNHWARALQMQPKWHRQRKPQSKSIWWASTTSAPPQHNLPISSSKKV